MEIRNKHYIIGLLFIGFIIRLIAFQSGFMFENDVNLFQFWGQQAFAYGLSQVYAGEVISFIDYPPGYIYVLYTLGAMAYRFGWERLDTMFNFFTFLPAMLADLGIGYIIYRMVAYGRFTKDKSKDAPPVPNDLPISATIRALKMSAFWILNPAIILISAVWGQVESVFVIFLLLSLILLKERRIIASYLLFGIAILIKAQSLFIAPVYLYSAFSYLMDSKKDSPEGKITRDAIMRLGVAVVSAVILMVLLVLPFAQGFNIMPIIRLYTGGLGTYPWASVNAFNFWGLITNVGHSWSPLTTAHVVISVLVVIALIIGSIYALHRDHTKYGGRYYYLIVGTLFALIFIFMVRMHERYLFPALTFFLLYYAQTREKRGIWLYAAASVTFFFNCTEVLRWLRAGAHGSGVMETSAPILSLANVAIGGILIYMFVKSEWMSELAPAPAGDGPMFSGKAGGGAGRRKPAQKAPPPPVLTPSEVNDPPPMGRKDYALLFLLIAAYSFIAFFRLGDFRTPVTSWTPQQGEYAIIDLGETQVITSMQYRVGAFPPHVEADFTIYASDDGVEWEHIQVIRPDFTHVFNWIELHFHNWEQPDVQLEARYMRVYSNHPGMRIQELAFRDAHGELMPIYSVSPGGEALVDEQHLVPEYRSFMNSTYFDEVYHARAGYEYLHGLNVFENTHPPMGKNFKAMSIAAFGMTPFGWRFPGTLAGVLMVPLIYALARLLFKSNNWALFAALIFSFDFMHFAQTRIATIDSYVTLFVIAMYFFMYRFLHGIERDSFKRKLVLLALCGVSVGLAVASKWQGLYAVLGLPILFFPALYRLYLRDKEQATRIFYACFGFFVAIPLVIYIVSYIPFLAATGGGGISAIWSNQVHMYVYHAGLDETHPFSSYWWEWPLNLRPIWFYAGHYVDGVRGTIASFGNPAVWWAGSVATIYMIFYFLTRLTPAGLVQYLKTSKSRRKRGLFVTKGFDKDIVFLLVAFGAQYLPWVIAARDLTWIYHFFPSVPFFVLIATWMFKHIIDRKPAWRPWIIGYGVLVVALFALFYPVLSGLPISVDFVQTYLHWLPRWFF